MAYLRRPQDGRPGPPPRSPSVPAVLARAGTERETGQSVVAIGAGETTEPRTSPPKGCGRRRRHDPGPRVGPARCRRERRRGMEGAPGERGRGVRTPPAAAPRARSRGLGQRAGARSAPPIRPASPAPRPRYTGGRDTTRPSNVFSRGGARGGHARHRSALPLETVRRPPGALGRRLHGRGGGDLRLPRPERGGEDDHDPDPDRDHEAHGGDRPHLRPGHPCARRSRPAGRWGSSTRPRTSTRTSPRGRT
jgi:hypothetical protein